MASGEVFPPCVSSKATPNPLPTLHRLARVPTGRVDASRRAVWYTPPSREVQLLRILGRRRSLARPTRVGFVRVERLTSGCCIRGYSTCRRSPHFRSRVSRRGDARPKFSRPSRSSSPTTRRRLVCFAARVWSRPRAETPEMSTFALSAAASARAHAQHAEAVSGARASRAASLAPTACHARRFSAVLASHRRLGDAAARSRVASWASSHRRASGTASASPADGGSPGSSRASASPGDGSDADVKTSFEDSEYDSYETFVASWRASLPTMEASERAEAHRASCAEGRRRANEKRRKRAVRSGKTSLPSPLRRPRLSR